MVLFQLPHRSIVFQCDLDVEKSPFNVTLTIEIEPKEFFGDADLTGRLREFPEGANIDASGNLFEGQARPTLVHPTRMNRFQFSQQISWGKLDIVGSIANITFVANDVSGITSTIQRVIELLPAAFSPISTSFISIKSFAGSVNNIPFTVQFLGNVPGGELIEVLEGRQVEVNTYFKRLMPVFLNLPRKIVSAHRYLSQNFLLESVSEYSYQFTGERILNLCKSLEALLEGEAIDSVEIMRSTLHSWNLHPRYIEVFASLKYLRNELDVAHIASSPISAEAHERVADFIGTAEKCMQALVLNAVNRFSNDPTLYSAKRTTIKDPPSIKFLENHVGLPFPRNGDLSTIP